jgi:hypothetical protein
MNPNSNEAPIHLPSPVNEQAPGFGGEQSPRNGEAAPSPERSAQSAPAAMPTAIPLPTQPAMPAQDQSTQTSDLTHSNPTSANNDDLIEKEWVNRAKAIVESTRNDPYKQSEELTVFKADYMKKRYNKAVKLSK